MKKPDPKMQTGRRRPVLELMVAGVTERGPVAA